jgi:hypothetical protein
VGAVRGGTALRQSLPLTAPNRRRVSAAGTHWLDKRRPNLKDG